MMKAMKWNNEVSVYFIFLKDPKMFRTFTFDQICRQMFKFIHIASYLFDSTVL